MTGAVHVSRGGEHFLSGPRTTEINCKLVVTGGLRKVLCENLKSSRCRHDWRAGGRLPRLVQSVLPTFQ